MHIHKAKLPFSFTPILLFFAFFGPLASLAEEPSDAPIPKDEIARSAAGTICIADHGATDKVFELAKSYARSLSQIKYAQDELAAASAPKNSPTDMLVHLKTAEAQFACAMLQLADFQQSSDKEIRENSILTLKVFDTLEAIPRYLQSEVRGFLDNKNKGKAESSKAEESAQMRIEIRNAWEKFSATQVLMQLELTKGNGALLITTKEREALIHELDKLINKKGKAAKTPVDNVASELMKFLKDKKWKSAS